MLSKFFIDRPVFASVISLLIMIVGALAIYTLPVEQYPEIVPPTIQITANYPGADAQTVAESVAAPIEQELSGVENLIYFSSQASNSGALTIVATFEIGTDQDLAAVEVQNRLSRAEPRLPQEVTRQGISVVKASTNILGVAVLESTNPQHDDIFLSNYATIYLGDALRRVPGVGDINVFGSRNYAMRIWVDPNKLATRGLTVSDVAAAIREQNAVFPAGSIGQRPVGEEVELTLPVLTRGRLSEPEEYEDIILRAHPDGSILRLEDVARVELGAQSYEFVSRVNGRATTPILIYLQPGANALSTIESVRQTLDDLSAEFPAGMSYRIPFDTTTFVEASIQEVVHTLFEAVILVVFVVFLFLQSWRATLIPLLAVPVAIVGTFAGMLALGFSINTLTLFGLVLAIGIVVDDAIVVVENVERILNEEGLPPREATIKAMSQVTGPVIAIVLVLSAVFIPVAFLGGLTGQLYRQFAVTIALSVAISGLVALTLSPALCRILLRPGHGRPFVLFRWFNAAFGALTEGYTRAVRTAIRYAALTIALFGVLCFATWRLTNTIPTGFIPSEDQGYIFTVVQLPDGASLVRTDRLVRRVEAYYLDHPAVANVVMLGGFDFLAGGTAAPNAAILFVSLKPFDQRTDPAHSTDAVAGATFGAFADVREGMVLSFNPPAIRGLGQRAGFEMQLQSRGGAPLTELADTSTRFLAAAGQHPSLSALSATLRFSVPQLFIHLDRDRAKVLGVRIADVFETLQAYLGSLYVNDFAKYGRIWRVQLQAESQYRDEPSDIDRVFVRNATGQMVPLSGVVTTDFRAGPNIVTRFNGFPSIQITGAPAPGVSSGVALETVADLAAQTLPPGYGFEWSGASYQEIQAGNQAPYVLAFGLLVVFLVLAAQYENWSLPIAVLLAVPVAVLGALLAILFRGLAQDIYFQIGLLTLVGLSAKNAILIVEFCAALAREGVPLRDAAAQAARLRFRPIVMTSLAFILGVVPLAISTGAGAAARHSIGTGVIGGMLAATFLAILFVPVFFVLVAGAAARLTRRRAPRAQRPAHA